MNPDLDARTDPRERSGVPATGPAAGKADIATASSGSRPVPPRPSAVASGAATVAVGAAGLAAGVAALTGATRPIRLDALVPLLGIQLHLTPLGGLFAVLIGAVAIPVGIYTVGYARAERLPRGALGMLPVFVAAMLLVPAADSVGTFLVAWELMAISSLVLVLADHRRTAVRAAGAFYAVLTHLGFIAILLALVLLAAAAGTGDFGGIAAAGPGLPTGTRSAVFLLALAGFGSKAGLLPLHAWLPRAHPEAPSPVSALMSAAMVALGCYGLLRIGVQLLGPGPRWWGLTLLALGAVSALFGVLSASVATDLKRLLAYSTTENMGLVAVGLGVAMTLGSSGRHDVAAIATTAALLHLLAHAAFKALGFLSAGAVLAGTGLRDLDRLGGLARRMPATAVLFGVAALGASGLPLGAGFVSEWLLLQGLIHSPVPGDQVLALAVPLTVGAVALTTGLGVVTMVKAFGVAFLARPRSAAAADARPAPVSMLAGMALAAAGCLVLAVAPVAVGPALAGAAGELPLGVVRLEPVLLRLPGAAGTVAPAVLGAGMLLLVLLSVLIGRRGSRQRPAAVTVPLWACGADQLSPRMQYTATSFAEPLQRVFDGVLRPDTDVQIDRPAGSPYQIERAVYRTRQVDSVERQLYRPVLHWVRALAGWVRRAHTGSVHLYLAYGGLGLLVVLVLGLVVAR
ncbi:MAG TPA: proton-conducting transporter membrane subunit [Nakamurella sp.]|nr:proton-conducting transporter membrane subunit [Nakamurella sp.]